MKHHPDRNPDDASSEEKFKEASEAAEVLMDAEKGQAYDQFGHAAVDGSRWSGFGGGGWRVWLDLRRCFWRYFSAGQVAVAAEVAPVVVQIFDMSLILIWKQAVKGLESNDKGANPG